MDKTILKTAPNGSATNKNISVFFIGGKGNIKITNVKRKLDKSEKTLDK